MKFKRNFFIYSLAAAAAAALISDTVMIALSEKFSFAAEDNMSVLIFLFPALFAAACYLVITLSAKSVIRRQRDAFNSLDVREEYSFFRNAACLLSAFSVVNSIILYRAFSGVFDRLYTEEVRKTHLMLSAESESSKQEMLDSLASRKETYSRLVIVSLVLLLIVKAFAYLFSARGFVRKYRSSGPSASDRRKKR